MDERRAPLVLSHHSKVLTDALLVSLNRACGPSHSGSLEDSDFAEDLARVRRSGYEAAIGFWYPNPFKEEPYRSLHQIQVVFGVNRTAQMPLSDGTVAAFQSLAHEPFNWLTVLGNESDLEWVKLDHMTWFLRRVRDSIPVLEPDFALGDTDVNVAANLGEDPRRVAWPWALYGPEMADRLGRERLRSAPAWRVEDLPYGGVWVQVTENPFTATIGDIARLAAHLGLEAPLSREE